MTNVLLISSDEHARGAMGCSGHKIVRTPALDRLAGQGTRFSRAYTPSPICVPARASLATGLHVHETRCWSSAEPWTGAPEGWAHRLRAAGCTPVSIGKLHYRGAGDDHGFADAILPMHVANDGMGWPQALLRQPLAAFEQTAEMARDVGAGDTDYSDYDRAVTRAACDWLGRFPARLADAPWALFVSFVSPHYPLTAPRPFFDLYRDLDIDLPQPRAAPDHPVLREMAAFWDYAAHFDAATAEDGLRAYYGLTSFLDANVRAVLEALEASGAARDTLMIYVSDHGEMLGRHGFWGKSVMYEDAVGIPMIAAGPGVPAGVSDTPASLIDIAPSIETACGLTPREGGTRWGAAALQSLIARPDQGRPILSEYHDGGSPTGLFMLRSERHKYVHFANGARPMVFDLARDPRECRDLSHHTALTARLEAQLRTMIDPEAIDRAAFADQAARIDALGGRHAIEALPGFNHTPVDGT